MSIDQRGYYFHVDLPDQSHVPRSLISAMILFFHKGVEAERVRTANTDSPGEVGSSLDPNLSIWTSGP